MVFWVEMLVVAAVVVGTAVLAVSRVGGLAVDCTDQPVPRLPADRPLTGLDLSRLRLGRGFYGYRTDQVEQLLERARWELDERDDRIVELTERLGRLQPYPVSQTSVTGGEVE